jgi:hypothetical protein
MEPSELLIPLATAGFGFLLRGVIPPLPAKPAGESEMWAEPPVSAYDDALKSVHTELEKVMKERAVTAARVEEFIANETENHQQRLLAMDQLVETRLVAIERNRLEAEQQFMEKVGAFLEPIKQELLESQAKLARRIDALTHKQQADNDGLALALKEDKQRLIDCHSQWAALEDQLNTKLNATPATTDLAGLNVEDLKQMLTWAWNDAAPALRRHQDAFNGLAQLNIGEFGQALLELQDRTEAMEDLLRGLLPESAMPRAARQAPVAPQAYARQDAPGEDWTGIQPPRAPQSYAPQETLPVAPPAPEEIPSLPADPQELLNALRRQAGLGFPPDMQQRFINGNGR